jgi:hypothetical protein
MAPDRVLKMVECELPPIDSGRRLKARKGPATKVKKIRIVKRLRGELGTSPETIRNRVVLQEMRRAYNQLTGLGDNLVDLRLSKMLSRRRGVRSLGKQDLCTLNYDLAHLVSAICGPVVAQRAYDLIGDVINETFT